MYKDLGNFVFHETAQMMKNPTSLILKLKGVGAWHLRKKRMDIVVNEWTDRSDPKSRDQFESDVSYENYMEKHKRYITFQARLREYDEYLEMKKQVNAKRRETQHLLTPKENAERFKSE